MMSPIHQNRRWIAGTLLAAGVAAGTVAAVAAATTPEERVISVTARRFEFSPSTIRLKLGEPVILDLMSLDRTHGFKIPALGIRSDILADTSVRVRVVPDKVGRFGFACDNFCGDDHEDMNGTIVISE
jgi:cytochrome c oxidase subunit II